MLDGSAAAQSKVLIVPDKDADGLDAGVILHKTLVSLGLSPDLIDVHLIGKNSTVHDEVERAAMQGKNPKYIIVVDQGSRAAPPIIDARRTHSLIIDHHLSDEFPKNATVLLTWPTPPRIVRKRLLICRSYLHATTPLWRRPPY